MCVQKILKTKIQKCCIIQLYNGYACVAGISCAPWRGTDIYKYVVISLKTALVKINEI